MYITCAERLCSGPKMLYFYIDASDSMTFENVCPLIITMQMLVATLTPSITSENQIGAMLFPDEDKERVPSTVFNVSNPVTMPYKGERIAYCQ